MNRFSIEITPRELDFGLCVLCGQTFRWTVIGPNRWMGVDGDVWIDAESTASELRVESNADEAQVRSIFRLDYEMAEVEARLLQCGPELRPFIDGVPGLRIMRCDPVETVFTFLCTPNNHLTRIGRMVEELGRRGRLLTERHGRAWHAFPNLETIAAINEEDLRANGFGYRGATIPNAARVILNWGPDWIDQIRSAKLVDARRRLTEIKGIGPKLADCMLLFGFGHLDAVPVDVHVWRMVRKLYYPEWQDGALTDKRYHQIGEDFRARFGPLAGWAHQYLFFEDMAKSRKPGAFTCTTD